MTKIKESRWNRYAVWRPLGLLTVAALTPPEWEITVIDETLRVPDYAAMPRPDLVGITAFTSQAACAYKVADGFRSRGVPVVMGGIHATMCLEEALERVDTVVTGEAESIWAQVLDDAQHGTLNRVYAGTHVDMSQVPPARHDLLPTGYRLGSIQTTRGCPFNCSFCSVTAFNGGRFRQRPIENVVQELGMIREKLVAIVDDNLIGVRAEHIARAKDLFRAMIQADLGKRWGTQVTINMADDEELLRLAAEAGCCIVFIGFESPTPEGLVEVHKRFNIGKGRDFRDSVRRIQRHGIAVIGGFIIGLDVDKPGIGQQIADTASQYGVDAVSVTFLTPLPGTRLWDKMEKEGRIVASDFPEDWEYYTVSFPVARYMHLSWADMLGEREACARAFHSIPRMMRRVLGSLMRIRRPFNALAGVAGNLYRGNWRHPYRERSQRLDLSRGEAHAKEEPLESGAAV